MGKNNKKNAFNAGISFGVDPEALDFSQDLWSWKGDIPSYPIQSDGFSYDIIDENENDRNAISLGILGMIIILYNTKSTKIKEEDVQPVLKEVINTRNWNNLQVKEANQLGKVVIAKLRDAESSGDVFDLASYAPLEIKRALLRKLFVIARHRLPSEYREEAERRITEDILPLIFRDPQLELALLTGLIVKPKTASDVSAPAAVSSAMPIADESNLLDTSVEFEPEDDNGDPVEPMAISAENAEEALKERIENLASAVPAAVEIEEEEQDDYVPFSDMEKDLAEKVESASASSVADSFLQPEERAEFDGGVSHTSQPASMPQQPYYPPQPVRKAQVPPPPVMPNVARPPMPGQPPASGNFPAPWGPHSQGQRIPPAAPYPAEYPYSFPPTDPNSAYPPQGYISQQEPPKPVYPVQPSRSEYPYPVDPHSGYSEPRHAPGKQPSQSDGEPHDIGNEAEPPAIERTQPRKR